MMVYKVRPVHRELLTVWTLCPSSRGALLLTFTKCPKASFRAREAVPVGSERICDRFFYNASACVDRQTEKVEQYIRIPRWTI